MINQGTIIADLLTALTINPSGSQFTNQGVMQATGAGGFVFDNGSFTNTGQTIQILDGSKLDADDVTISGGTLHTSGSGVINLGVTSATNLTNVTLDGDVRQANDDDTTVTGGLTNNGTWQLNSTGSATQATFNGSTTLGGTGEIVMSDNVNNRIRTGGTLTQAAGHTIRGAGALLNNTGGTIIADLLTALTIDPSGATGMINEGTLRATNSGGINIVSGAFENRALVEIESTSSLTRTGNYLQTSGTTMVDGVLAPTGTSVNLQGGVLGGTGTVTTSVNNTGGQVAPGNSPGRLDITGDYSQSDLGSIAIELGGYAAETDFDLLAVSGDATDLAGNVDVTLINGFLPTVGDMFTFLVAAQVSGALGVNCIACSGRVFDVDIGTDFAKLTVPAVPLPPAALLFASALIGMAVVSRRRSAVRPYLPVHHR